MYLPKRCHATQQCWLELRNRVGVLKRMNNSGDSILDEGDILEADI
jgi:hypothetical protein